MKKAYFTNIIITYIFINQAKQKNLATGCVAFHLGQASPNGGPLSGSGPSDGSVRTRDQSLIDSRIFMEHFFCPTVAAVDSVRCYSS